MKRSLGQQILLIAFAAGLIASGSAQAEDAAPGWRDAPGTAYGEWEFDDDANPPTTTSENNPSATQPDAHMKKIEGTAVWVPTSLTGKAGVWKLIDAPDPPAEGGKMTIFLPNTLDPQGIKEMWIQITYLGTLGEPRVDVPNMFQRFESKKNALDGGWVHWITKYVSNGCPASESIGIRPPAGGVALIDHIVTDTICRRQR